MKNSCTFIVCLLLTLLNISCSKKVNKEAAEKITLQVQNKQPSSYSLDSQIEIDPYAYNFSTLTDDAAEILFKELQEASTLEYIASASGFSQEELNCSCIVFDSDKLFEIYNVNLYLTDSHFTNSNVPVFNTVSKILEIYIRERLNGHTREYIKAVLNSDINPESISDPELKDLSRIYPDILISWVKKASEDQVELQEGMARQVNFVIIDGNIAWRYPILYNPDSTVSECIWDFGRCDAKEYDPAYIDIIKEVEKEVDERMDRENITGIGSIHAFWYYKKEHLKKRGIDWKSPSDLNPGTFFD